MKFRSSIEFDRIVFEDMESEAKSEQELLLSVLLNAKGENINDRKYSQAELSRAARLLILNGCLRGTVFSKDKCIWSRLTMKGSFFLKSLIKSNKDNIMVNNN